MEGAGWRDAIPAGADVALKVNLGWDRFIPGSITSPAVLEALALEMKPRAGRIFVIEADQVLAALHPVEAANLMVVPDFELEGIS